MKKAVIIVLCFAVLLSIWYWYSHERTPNEGSSSVDTLRTGHVQPKQVKGGKFPEVKHDLKRPLNEVDTPHVVPTRPSNGNMQPNNPSFKIKERKPDSSGHEGDSQTPLNFNGYDEIGNATPSAHLYNPEPSVAVDSLLVMTTGNFWMSLSKDGGQNFTTVNPSTVFPEDFGGFCCDQVVQYIPRWDLFVWLLQYGSNATGVNAIRIAVQTAKEVRNSNGTSWTYWDFSNTTFAPSGNL